MAKLTSLCIHFKMHVQTHSVFHTLSFTLVPFLVFWFTHPCPLPSWLNRKPRRNGLPSTHFIYDVISYTCCCKTHSPAKQKKPSFPKPGREAVFAIQGMTDSNEENSNAGCLATMGVTSCKNVIKVVIAQNGMALMVEGTFQKTFMNNPNTQMHKCNFYLKKKTYCYPPFTYVYKLIYCRI